MKLEGWNVTVFLLFLVAAGVVARGVTLLVAWTVRRLRRRSGGGDSGAPLP